MEYVLAALIVLGAWHYVYESILLPAIHTSLRNKFFSLRDELRNFSFDNEGYDRAAFAIAENGLNTAINSVNALDLAMQVRVHRRITEDAKFRAQVEERSKVLENTKDEVIREVVKKANGVLRDVFVMNSGGWFIFVIPIALVVLCSKTIMKLSDELFSMREQDADGLLSRHALAC